MIRTKDQIVRSQREEKATRDGGILVPHKPPAAGTEEDGRGCTDLPSLGRALQPRIRQGTEDRGVQAAGVQTLCRVQSATSDSRAPSPKGLQTSPQNLAKSPPASPVQESLVVRARAPSSLPTPSRLAEEAPVSLISILDFTLLTNFALFSCWSEIRLSLQLVRRTLQGERAIGTQ